MVSEGSTVHPRKETGNNTAEGRSHQVHFPKVGLVSVLTENVRGQNCLGNADSRVDRRTGVRAREEDHSSECEGDDGASEEGNGGFVNIGGETLGTLVFDEKDTADKDEGAEHLDK